MTQLADYLPVMYRVGVSGAIALFAVLLNEKLPSAIEPAMRRHMEDTLSSAGPRATELAVTLAVIASDFVSGAGAIFGLFAALLTELWKLSDELRHFVPLSLFLAAISAGPLALAMFRFKWIQNTREEYEKGTGRLLRWTVRILSVGLISLSLLAGLLELQSPSTSLTGEI